MSLRDRLVESARRGLKAAAERSAGMHRVLEIGRREIDRALRDDWYDGAYFAGADGGIASHYGTYTRDSSNADVAAYLLWRYFPARTSLDVGCALGFVVEALRERGIDAQGVDTSQYAIEHAALGALGHLRYANLKYRLPFGRGRFELVSALETLEHLPPELVPHAISELARVSSRWVVATIPSLGPNEFGPGGWLEAKVKQDRLAHYKSLGDGYEGPVPYDDLFLDERGDPIEGHLTIASFDWWTAQFAAAGLVRCGAVERRMHPQLARFGMTKYWNLYVLRKTDASEPPSAEIRSPDEVADVETKWRLDRWHANHEDVDRVKAILGADCFDGVPLEFGEG